MAALFGLFFIFGTRSKFFYFLAAFALEKLSNSYLKLAIAHPRPYMINSNIIPVSCSKAFGTPSGHSSSSMMFAIIVFMDIFHSKSLPYARTRSNYGWMSYIVTLILVAYWAMSIPFTRFILGAHSLDQILFGTSLGIWQGIIMHFVVRDNLIEHIEELFEKMNLKTRLNMQKINARKRSLRG